MNAYRGRLVGVLLGLGFGALSILCERWYVVPNALVDILERISFLLSAIPMLILYISFEENFDLAAYVGIVFGCGAAGYIAGYILEGMRVFKSSRFTSGRQASWGRIMGVSMIAIANIGAFVLLDFCGGVPQRPGLVDISALSEVGLPKDAHLIRSKYTRGWASGMLVADILVSKGNAEYLRRLPRSFSTMGGRTQVSVCPSPKEYTIHIESWH